MKKTLLLFWFALTATACASQVPAAVRVVFTPTFGEALLRLDQAGYALQDGSAVKIETLKFYVTDVQLYQDGQPVYTEKSSYHLLDAAAENSLQFVLTLPATVPFNQLRFHLGIDSLTNESGAMGGDLDPTKGMYWTWQSGYINFKLEGSSPLCKTPRNEFQFHLGGYRHPYNALQTVALQVLSAAEIHINFDVKKVLEQVDLRHQNQIMSPNAVALKIAGNVVSGFSVREP